MPFQLGKRILALGAGGGFDQIDDRLRFDEIQLAVQKGALGKFARLRHAAALLQEQLADALQNI